MSSLIEAMRQFFAKLENDEEGKKVLSFLERDFQFKMAEGSSLAMRVKGNRFSFEEGDLSDQDFRRVTLVYADEAILRDLIAGRVGPSEAYFSGRIGMREMLSGGAYGHALLRLFRRGQELSR
jgi:hypothetical protein